MPLFDMPFDILPKAAVPAVVGSAFLAYFVVGPEIASRVARVDHIPACERDIASSIVADAAKRRAAVDDAAPDPAKEAAAEALREFARSPLFGEMRRHPLGNLMGLGQISGAVTGYERGKAKAAEVARSVREEIDALAATHLGRAGSVCGCMADRAITETRMEWAVFTATLGLVRPARIAMFGETMRRSDPDGLCRKEVQP